MNSDYILHTAMAMGIIFVAAVQQRSSVTNLQALRIEAVQATLATFLFFWTNPIGYYVNWKRLAITGLTLV